MKKETFETNQEVVDFMIDCGFLPYESIFATSGAFIYPSTGIIIDLSASGSTPKDIMSHIIKATFEYGQKEKENQIKKVLGI